MHIIFFVYILGSILYLMDFFFIILSWSTAGHRYHLRAPFRLSQACRIHSQPAASQIATSPGRRLRILYLFKNSFSSSVEGSWPDVDSPLPFQLVYSLTYIGELDSLSDKLFIDFIVQRISEDCSRYSSMSGFQYIYRTYKLFFIHRFVNLPHTTIEENMYQISNWTTTIRGTGFIPWFSTGPCWLIVLWIDHAYHYNRHMKQKKLHGEKIRYSYI